MAYNRDLWGMAEGDPTLGMNQSTNTSAYSKFALALMQMLKQQQGMGTQQFVNAQQQGIQEQSNRIMATPPQGLVGANPALQNQVRNAQVSAMNPTIEGVGKLGKTFSEQIAGLGDAISQARAIGSMIQDEELTKQQRAIDMIYKFPTAVKALDDKSKKSLAQQAGVPLEFINSLPDAEISEKPVTQTVGKTLLERDSKTGKWNVVYKEPEETTTTPASSQISYSSEKTKDAIKSVDNILSKTNNRVVGLLGSVSSRVQGTEAYDYSALLSTLKSQIAFRELVAMREASKTGGALGQVSDRENQLLQDALGALDQGQSVSGIKANLSRVRESLQRWEKISSGKLPVKEIKTGKAGWIDQSEFDPNIYEII